MAGGCGLDEGKPEGICTVLVDQFERVECVACRLRHLPPLAVADHPMDQDVGERGMIGEVHAHHHHAGDPEEDDVEPGHQHVRWVEILEVSGLLRPAERRERPQRR